MHHNVINAGQAAQSDKLRMRDAQVILCLRVCHPMSVILPATALLSKPHARVTGAIFLWPSCTPQLAPQNTKHLSGRETFSDS